ncbi:MAG TPA: acetyl-CoA hydrolase/transferase C-terminal domain-containing protein, partial [Steroidobacteraceae bacterium]|nr:acetyl-CoA hydrolase/transferase C-terminal domain-containing protein [Steroidobacteraceae bacterium]
LERRLLEPLVERVFGSYVELDYVRALRADALPSNVRIIEFFLEPGAYLGVPHSQRNYLSANYTHVAREAVARGVNVVAQLVARRIVNGEVQLSFGSNPDVTADLLLLLDAAKPARGEIAVVGQVHPQMPFMLDQALVAPDRFDYLIDDPRATYDLYCPPNLPIGTVDHAIALHASALVRDGGTLQIGIGELGDALVYALLLRHQQNAAWRAATLELGAERGAATIDAVGGREPFAQGLFGATEMLIDQMLDLYRAGVLRRRVYDSLPLQRLLDEGRIEETFDASILEALVAAGVGPRLTADEFAELQRFGVFRSDVRFDAGLLCARGERIPADLGDPAARSSIAAACLGRRLTGGRVVHAGFFMGPRGFYAALRDLDEHTRSELGMRGVAFVNQLYGADFELRVLQRRHARFFNTTMMVTLLGASVSDALESGAVVSGVGGQYNFVAMAHALPGGRALICLRSTRTSAGRTRSNILWSYGHATIPRHLRDIVVTEYGIADLRGRTDEETIAALLNVADSRFQPLLLEQAKAAGKIAGAYTIPDAFRDNTPQRLERTLAAHRGAGLFGEYPFGTDLTSEEIALAKGLKRLKAETATWRGRFGTLARTLSCRKASEAELPALRRIGLGTPAGLRGRALQRLVLQALRRLN